MSTHKSEGSLQFQNGVKPLSTSNHRLLELHSIVLKLVDPRNFIKSLILIIWQAEGAALLCIRERIFTVQHRRVRERTQSASSHSSQGSICDRDRRYLEVPPSARGYDEIRPSI